MQQRQGPGSRSVKLVNGLGRSDRAYAGNTVRTSKYTCVTFLPLNLYEQLHKFGNVYFLSMSILMYLGEKTPLFVGTIKAASTLATLLAMMALTAVLALFEDRRRAASDKEINNQWAHCIRGTRPEPDRKRWAAIEVGDLLCVQQDEEFPADIVPLYCDGAEGSCYVSTANLDGETNLKLKAAPPASQRVLGGSKQSLAAVIAALPKLAGAVEAEAPKASIHSFLGRLELHGPQASEEALGPRQLLLRGTTLRNTSWVLGVVVYTGDETRMVMNSRAAPLKQSNLERITNTVMLVVLAAQCFIALVSDVLFLASQDQYHHYWYLYPPDITLPKPLGYWLTFFVLYSNLMPISLYPTMEVCNAVQAYFIKNDVRMYYEDESTDVRMPAGVKSAGLCQELGQVNYIFSDKTGTLTQNVMEVKRLFVKNAAFGTVLEGERGFNGAEELHRAGRDKECREATEKLLQVLAVAHTVMVTVGGDGNDRFEAESPDEAALVEVAANLGWAFRGNAAGKTVIEVHGEGQNKTREYRVLATNQFDSTRKRMSVLVQHGNDHLLLCKGADNVMLQPGRAASVPEQLQRYLSEFAQQGLRTLVIAQKQILRSQEVEAWLTKYRAAECKLEGRDEALAAVAEEIELGLEVVGATAIEDKLQDMVPQTIEKIRQADIKLWVLTGDKLETARNIGYSSRVLTDEMCIEELDRTVDEQQVSWDLYRKSQSMKQAAGELQKVALLITGAALEDVEANAGLRRAFLELAEVCSIVLACRVSPLQKAQLVRMVREGVTPTPVTLAVGDGANDVPMIQEAQVGVGIAGREGHQAMNNSDFSIGQFKYLQQLLFVHGRWNYRRICKFTLFTFWRNAVQVLMIWYYTFISGFSGTSIFEDWLRLSFNFLCSLPIMATGCFDQDIDAESALEHPDLYIFGRESRDLNYEQMGSTLLSAFTHSVILLGVTMFAFPHLDLYGVGDYYAFGTAAYTCLLVDMNLRVIFLNRTHNVYTLGSVALSFVLYVVYLLAYPCTKVVADTLTPNMYMVPVQLAKVPVFWLCILTVPVAAVTVDVLINTVRLIWNPLSLRINRLRQEQLIRPHPWVSFCEDYRPLAWERVSWENMSTSEDSLGTTSTHPGLDLSSFAQQACTGLPCDPHRYICRVATFAGLVLALLGIYAIDASHRTQQIRIEYAGTTSRWTVFDHLGTKDHEVFKFQDECRDALGMQNCTINVIVPETMEPPILMYYALGPFYQNYNDYIKSEVVKELMGDVVDERVRQRTCNLKTRQDADGNSIVPCGMKATSVFNDTFIVEGYNIRKKGVAWQSDVDRYNNPPDYKTRTRVSWLYDRYPDLVQEADGVKNEQFAVWMRPSALWRVWNPYGWLEDKRLEKGQNLTVVITSNYPVDGMDGYKHLVLTTLGPVGGRNDLFGYLLLGCGGLCLILALITAATLANCCPGLEDFDD